MSGFLNVKEAVTLTGLTKKTICQNCKAGKYITRQVKGNGGLRYEIALTSLPKTAQEIYQKQQAQLALAQLNEQANLEDIPQAEQALKDYAEQQKHRQHVKEDGLSQFALLPKAKKDHAKAKQRLLMALYQTMRQTGLKKRPAIKWFCAAVNRGLDSSTVHPSTVRQAHSSGRTESKLMSFDSSMGFDSDDLAEAIELHPVIRAVIPVRFGVQQLGVDTLIKWLYSYERHGIIALVDKSSNAGRQCVIAENEGLKRYVIGFMVKFPLASASKIKAALAAQKPDLDVVHERSIDRYMKQWKTENAQLWTYVTHPDKWKSVYMPAYGSHFEGIERLNQLWEMDSTPWDAILVDGRHSVLAVIDLFSRRMVFHVSKTSSCLHFSRWR